ncbi:hypothetical protein L1987_50004 [Smallanthus sonchifolius]|uniref:Uncharacterized protein n=1 Tax=Smallanthus sonchifolius TaxID=185202 RepID=A0ACB9FX99_9ASTR|nr:hypothetical protein L1987_50004 [Smallanthus sonchifolius]
MAHVGLFPWHGLLLLTAATKVVEGCCGSADDDDMGRSFLLIYRIMMMQQQQRRGDHGYPKRGGVKCSDASDGPPCARSELKHPKEEPSKPVGPTPEQIISIKTANLQFFGFYFLDEWDCNSSIGRLESEHL